MFQECFSIKELNLSNFNTDNVTDMDGMFFKCSSLKKLDISNFNFKEVNSMTNMFYHCSNLEDINIYKLNIKQEVLNHLKFGKCSLKLKEKLQQLNENILDDAFLL